MNADANLYAIVFGESIFNDAISIVMYETVKNLGTEEDVTIQAKVFEAICQFTLIFVGSILIGAFSALTVAFLKKRLIGDIKVS
jgi:NhaP-type Na+/H+ or K+/H+ antiporter